MVFRAYDNAPSPLPLYEPWIEDCAFSIILELYCELVFDEILDADVCIELPEPVSDNKTDLRDLQVYKSLKLCVLMSNSYYIVLQKNDHFVWRIERVKKQVSSREKRLKFKNSKYSDFINI